MLLSSSTEIGSSLSGQVWFNQSFEEVLSANRGENVPLMTAMVLHAFPIHQGLVFGLPTKIIAFTVALVVKMTRVTDAPV